MLRALVLLLALANVAFFAWTQGALPGFVAPPADGGREPQRLARQVNPELVQLISPAAARAAAAPAVAAPPTVCVEAGPFAPAEVAAAEQVLAELPAGSWQRLSSERAPGYAVVLGRFADAAAAQARQAALRQQQIDAQQLSQPAELAPGLSLGRFGERSLATVALAGLAGQGVRDARVVALPALTEHWLRVDPATPALLAQITALPSAALAGGFRPCVER